jgi:small subunit ribosomal protein S3
VGQKVNPFGFRLGVFESWRARWFAKKKDYGKTLVEDFKIRRFMATKLVKGDTERVEIERTGDSVKLVVHTRRPGVAIGKKGQGIEQLKADFSKEFGRNVDVSINEVKSPDTSASLIGLSIAEQIERRANFKKVMKKAGFAALKAGAKGIKICCSGRLGGAEIARREWFRFGSVPLHTLRSKIDYALVEAQTTYGKIGIQVWSCKGEY